MKFNENAARGAIYAAGFVAILMSTFIGPVQHPWPCIVFMLCGVVLAGVIAGCYVR